MVWKMNRRDFIKAGSGLGAAAILGTAGADYIREQGKELEESSLLQGSFYSVPPSSFDPVMGFRWRDGPIRWVGICNDEVIFDNTFSGNNYGSLCSYDFTPKKPSQDTFRFMVLGDSFTAGLELPQPWPERFQHLLRSRSEKRPVEVYPFPTDGGGLVNWHSVFTKLILPEFEFDALVIGSWFENLARKFVIFHADNEYNHWMHFDKDKWPGSQEEFEKVRPKMEKFCKVVGEQKLDEIVRQAKQKGRFTSVSVDDYMQQKPPCVSTWSKEWQLAPPDYVFSIDAFIKRYSAERLTMFTEIVEACKKRNIPVIFCAIPTRAGLLRMRKENTRLIHRLESEGLCSHFGLHYFDGYAAFDGIDAEAIVDLYWLKYDAHWAQAAGDLFALKLAEWVTLKNIIPPPNRPSRKK